jgi:hypothetical protein
LEALLALNCLISTAFSLSQEFQFVASLFSFVAGIFSNFFHDFFLDLLILQEQVASTNARIFLLLPHNNTTFIVVPSSCMIK